MQFNDLKDLKTVIVPPKANCLMHHNFKMFSILTKYVRKKFYVAQNSCLKIFKPLTLGIFLTNIKNISKTSINKCTDIGSPC